MRSVSVITLAVDALAPSRRFYAEGFGWTPVFENEDIVFYQLNGTVLGTYLKAAFAADMNRPTPAVPGGFSLAQNVASQAEVQPVVDRLLAAGGALIRAPDAPPHGGWRGYVADPDGHAWEIAWQPGFVIDADGNATFGT